MRKTIISGITRFGLMFAIASSSTTAQTPHAMESQPSQTGQFHRIEQPLANKAIVTFGGLSLIGLELWWFLFSKPKSRKAPTQSDIR